MKKQLAIRSAQADIHNIFSVRSHSNGEHITEPPYIGGPGDDSIWGDSFGDSQLYGNGGDDSLVTGWGDDELYGGPGDDSFTANRGNDELTGGPGNDSLTGDEGADTFIFAPGDSTGPATSPTWAPLGISGDVITDFNPREGDRIELRGFSSNTLTITGVIDAGGLTANDDRIITLPDGGKIILYNVDDVPLSAIRIEGFTIREVGDDPPATGGDTDPPPADDGDAGTDPPATGNTDNNDPPATAGPAPALGVRFDGGAGNDQLTGGPGNDDLRGYDGDDILYGGAGNDRLAGMAGVDDLDGGPGDDTSYGGSGNDQQTGGSGADRLYGEGGDDEMYGGSGDDRLSGGSGNDRLYGEGGDDEMYGGSGDDRLFGDNRLDAGDDQIYGGPGDDYLNGGQGDDLLSGGPGADELTGGPGADFFRFVPGHSTTGGGDVILDYSASEGDFLDLSAFNIDSDQDGLSATSGVDADGDGYFDDTRITLPDGGIINLIDDPPDAEIWFI